MALAGQAGSSRRSDFFSLESMFLIGALVDKRAELVVIGLLLILMV